MKSNRRSVLIGLGALTVGGGAVFGTGAFSSVDADRQVTLGVEDDASALVGLEILSDTLAGEDGNDGVISFDEERLNQNGLTEFSPGLEITNNSNNTDINVSIKDGTDDLITEEVGDEEYGMFFETTTTVTDGEITISGNEELDVVFNLEQDASVLPDEEITVSANAVEEEEEE